VPGPDDSRSAEPLRREAVRPSLSTQRSPCKARDCLGDDRHAQVATRVRKCRPALVNANLQVFQQWAILGMYAESDVTFFEESESVVDFKGVGTAAGRWEQTTHFNDGTIYFVVSSSNGSTWSSRYIAAWTGEVSVRDEGTWTGLVYSVHASGPNGDGEARFRLPFVSRVRGPVTSTTVLLGDGRGHVLGYPGGNSLPFDARSTLLGALPEEMAGVIRSR